MIVNFITAENVLKYRRLDLLNLPSNGLITMCGQNESGKSTIGETICFALFGRTFSVGEDDLHRVIRWGESRCSVKMGFSVEGKDYEVARFLDDEGNHAARVYLAGDPDNVLAKGVEAVGQALDGLLGYQFEEFVESFYLAQREITTPHPHSHTVKTMAGISALERVATTLRYEKESASEEIPEVEKELETIVEDVEGIGIDPDQLGVIQGEASEIRCAGDLLRERDAGLVGALADYEAALPQLRSAKITSILGWGIGVASAITAILAGAAWLLITQAPDAEIPAQLRSWLSERWAGKPSLLAIAAGIAGLIAVISWGLGYVMGRKAVSLREQGNNLAYQLKGSEEAVDVIDSSFDDIEQTPDETLIAIRQCKLNADSTSSVVGAARKQVAGRIEQQEAILQEHEGAIEKEEGRRSKADRLDRVAETLTEKLSDKRKQVKLRELADELIHSSARHISQRFNKDLRELASGTLPLFTEGRYEHLQIDADLRVKVFSNLKRDFMDLEEISSGTGRQIMLAVRLALSQELAKSTATGSQFIFLDEPFAFFDPVRTRNAMEVLPKISKELSQIWVIAQEFPEGSESALSIDCSRDFEELVVR